MEETATAVITSRRGLSVGFVRGTSKKRGAQKDVRITGDEKVSLISESSEFRREEMLCGIWIMK